jgi:hypothetical protein
MNAAARHSGDTQKETTMKIKANVKAGGIMLAD